MEDEDLGDVHMRDYSRRLHAQRRRRSSTSIDEPISPNSTPRTRSIQTHRRVPSPDMTSPHPSANLSSRMYPSSPTTSPTRYPTIPSRRWPISSTGPTMSSGMDMYRRSATTPSRSSSIAPIPEDAVLDAPGGVHATFDHGDPDAQRDLKTTLTDLLNCEAFRHDESMRAWIQSRLMDAEQEHKRHRKRRLSRSTSLSSDLSVGGHDELEDHRLQSPTSVVKQ